MRGQWIVTDSFPRTNLIADRSLAVVTPRSALLSIDLAVRSLCDPLTYNYKFSWIQSTLGIALYAGGWPATSGFQLLRTLPVDLILSVCIGPRIMGLHFIALVSTCLWKRRWTSETIEAVIDDYGIHFNILYNKKRGKSEQYLAVGAFPEGTSYTIQGNRIKT